MVKTSLFLLFLAVNTISDFRKKEILIGTIPVFTITAVVMSVQAQVNGTAFVLLFWDMIPGLLLLILSVLTKGAVGFGDGLVVLVCGLYVGFLKTIAVIMGAFFLASLAGGVLIIFKKAHRKTALPFLPFLSAMCVLLCIGGGL